MIDKFIIFEDGTRFLGDPDGSDIWYGIAVFPDGRACFSKWQEDGHAIYTSLCVLADGRKIIGAFFKSGKQLMPSFVGIDADKTSYDLVDKREARRRAKAFGKGVRLPQIAQRHSEEVDFYHQRFKEISQLMEDRLTAVIHHQTELQTDWHIVDTLIDEIKKGAVTKPAPTTPKRSKPKVRQKQKPKPKKPAPRKASVPARVSPKPPAEVPAKPQHERFEVDSGRAVYEGDALHGRPHGFGELKRLDGSVHTGEFRNGLPHGFGELKDGDVNGDIYVGEFANGLRHGKGKLMFTSWNRRFTFEGMFHQGGCDARHYWRVMEGSDNVTGWFSILPDGRVWGTTPN